MRLRYRFLLSLIVGCLAFAGTAFAAKSIQPATIGNGPMIHLGTNSTMSVSCVLGVPPPFSGGFTGLIGPPDDEYYTLIDPAACPASACTSPDPANSILLTTAHAGLFFPHQCVIAGHIVIVGAAGDPTCYTPDPTNILCGPVNFVLNPQGNLNVALDFAVPLPTCCINRPVFLGIIYDGTNCPGGEPGNLYQDPCQNCVEYNIFPGNPAPGTDLCPYLSGYGFGNPLYWVDATCCAPDATVPHTWGRIKSLYR